MRRGQSSGTTNFPFALIDVRSSPQGEGWRYVLCFSARGASRSDGEKWVQVAIGLSRRGPSGAVRSAWGRRTVRARFTSVWVDSFRLRPIVVAAEVIWQPSLLFSPFPAIVCGVLCTEGVAETKDQKVKARLSESPSSRVELDRGCDGPHSPRLSLIPPSRTTITQHGRSWL